MLRSGAASEHEYRKTLLETNSQIRIQKAQNENLIRQYTQQTELLAFDAKEETEILRMFEKISVFIDAANEYPRIKQEYERMCEHRDCPVMDGVYGTVDELFEIKDRAVETAVHVIVQGRQKYVVVETDEIAEVLVKTQKEKRISVIPLNKIAPKFISKHILEKAKECGGMPALDVVDFFVETRRAMEYIFGSYLIFRDKKKAREFCHMHNILCVTYDGDLYDPRGTLTGGTFKDTKHTSGRTNFKQLKEKYTKVAQLKEIYDAQEEHFSDIVKKKHKVAEKQALELRIASVKTETERLSETLEKNMRILESGTDYIALEKEKEREMLAIKHEIRNVEILLAHRREIEAEIEKTAALVQEIHEKQKHREERERILTNRIAGLTEHIAEWEKKIEKTRGMSLEELESMNEKRHRYTEQSVVLCDEIAVLSENYEAVQKRVLEMSEKDSFEQVGETEITDINAQIAEITEQYQTVLSMKNKLNTNPKIFTLLEHNERTEKDLRNKIDKLVEDRKKIQNTLDKLNRLEETAVRKVYESVSENIGHFLRFFIQDADAKLVSVKNNLTNGIEIAVKIGEWKNSLRELSGGQRSLVGLCLIFSLLSYHSSPIYIFDEIDSALDMQHTQSVGEIIKKEFENSQFLVVSLKEGLYNNANLLFRVTHKEGNSTIARISRRVNKQ